MSAELLDTFGFPTTDRTGTLAFFREQVRHSIKARTLDCNHRIDPREPYRYEVWKVYGERGVGQRRECDVCKRRDSRY
jgi:hypothetical protein